MITGTQLAIDAATVHGRAEISPCGRYRFRLERWWYGPDNTRAWLPVIMLNPSVADAERDDPTIRRVIGFAMREGYHGIIVANMFGLRATDPRALAIAADPIGAGNAAAVERAIWDAHPARPLVVAAWGGKYPRRWAGWVKQEAARFVGFCSSVGRKPMCLGVTKDGDPRHPLYLAASTPLVPFDAIARAA